MKNILVTGGLGFIGQHIVKALLARDEDSKITVLDDMSGVPFKLMDFTFPNKVQPWLNDTGRITVSIGKISEAFSKTIYGFQGTYFDEIYHFAAYAAEGLSHHIRQFNCSNNILESEILINHAIRMKCPLFHFASSAAVYGHQCEIYPDVSENEAKPIDPYGSAKLFIENSLSQAHQYFKLPTQSVCWRMHNVIGEGQNLLDPYRNVCSIFLKQIMQGDPLTIFGDGLQSRQFTDVVWLANVIVNSHTWQFRRPAQVLNIGTDQQTTIQELIKELSLAIYQGALPTQILRARKEAKTVVCDHERLYSYGVTDSGRSLREILSGMYDWALANYGSLVAPGTPEVEIPNELPEGW